MLHDLRDDKDTHVESSLVLAKVSSDGAVPDKLEEGSSDGFRVDPGDEFNEEHCTICLQPVIDRAVIPICSHEFCFECLMVWADQSRRCPLCAQTFGEYVIHHIRSNYDYVKHFLPPLRASPMPAHRNPGIQHDSAPVRELRRPSRREREWGRRVHAVLDEADALERAVARRKWIYRHGLYAKHVASNSHTRYRPYPTPARFSASPELISRATIFVRRELQAWPNLDIEFLVTFVIALMKAIDIRAESAVKLLAEFLDMDAHYVPGARFPNAEHFAHEVYSYMRSPYKDLARYDESVQYDVPVDLLDPAPYERSRRWEPDTQRSISPQASSASRSQPSFDRERSSDQLIEGHSGHLSHLRAPEQRLSPRPSHGRPRNSSSLTDHNVSLVDECSSHQVRRKPDQSPSRHTPVSLLTPLPSTSQGLPCGCDQPCAAHSAQHSKVFSEPRSYEPPPSPITEGKGKRPVRSGHNTYDSITEASFGVGVNRLPCDSFPPPLQPPQHDLSAPDENHHLVAATVPKEQPSADSIHIPLQNSTHVWAPRNRSLIDSIHAHLRTPAPRVPPGSKSGDQHTVDNLLTVKVSSTLQHTDDRLGTSKLTNISPTDDMRDDAQPSETDGRHGHWHVSRERDDGEGGNARLSRSSTESVPSSSSSSLVDNQQPASTVRERLLRKLEAERRHVHGAQRPSSGLIPADHVASTSLDSLHMVEARLRTKAQARARHAAEKLQTGNVVGSGDGAARELALRAQLWSKQ